MPFVIIAHLGPTGTYAETTALAYGKLIDADFKLLPCNTITQAIEAVSNQAADLAVVPIENSIEGSVTMTLDALWRIDGLQIQRALVLPIEHHALVDRR